MDNNSQKEKEAKRKNPMKLWILPLMGKLMENSGEFPTIPPIAWTTLRVVHSLHNNTTATYSYFFKNQKTGSF
jgi:hypothetical protein